MTILIITQNAELVQDMTKTKLSFTAQTARTSTFKIGPKAFEVLKAEARSRGFNPFALFTW